ncbi:MULTISPECIES: ABC transporter substrate-binding protein [Leclercia]|jgi:peptide/nickel transport system substrate-binding protein|uniref:ABC transporter substrate-binding protein n=1 Tax=Leclercia adecarboxylata TaxID=83655 RepID=A0A9X3Y7D4_9ENTR|nr:MULTISPECIES: ABC transporter substrate-binding protein [Leclercia]POW72530.1 ABC transporter substrate-binding protein [Leclercia sp. LSNIH4]ALZ95864.1 ABC transporter substrate-binding protein [Leclercia adecarboxylata]AUY40819.1 ABC transporter substrate-binding protein [Leclercia sp. LSNIH3]MBD1403407.1 ABC transporter substrate-binding protein [Leclercia adecarboxylata]MBK0349210.1 ABC transporter substrate-binding protein [Leclercia adecarboxylata]
MKKNSLTGACLLALSLMMGSGAAYAKTPPDQLIIGMNMNNLLTLDPAAMTGNEVVGIVVNLYDSLVELDPNTLTNVKPALAKSWDISPDGKTLTFHLRDNVTFHSGNPLTAEDVVWSMRRLLHLNLAQASVWKSYGFSKKNIDQQIKALDDYTVQLTLPKANDPQLVIYSLGALGNLGVLDRKTVLSHEVNSDWGNRWLTTNEAGSGPFMLETWQAKDVLRMQRNPNYWREEPKMNRVVLRHFQESQTLRLMVEKGDLDIASNMAVADINALRKDPQLTVEAVQKGTVYYVAMSMKEAHFANPKVREAVRYLIDYQGINKALMPGYGVLHQRPIKAGMPSTLPDPGYKLDIPRAKKLLAEAGYPDGFDTTLRVLADQPFLNIAIAVQSTLMQAGINAKIITGTGNQIYGAMRERKFDMLVGRGGSGVEPHPHSSLRALVYNPDNSDEARLTNFQGWRTSFYDKPLNEMIDKALLERDPQKQVADYQQIQVRYDQLIPALLPLSQMVDSVVVRNEVKNFQSHPSATTFLREVYKTGGEK